MPVGLREYEQLLVWRSNLEVGDRRKEEGRKAGLIVLGKAEKKWLVAGQCCATDSTSLPRLAVAWHKPQTQSNKERNVREP